MNLKRTSRALVLPALLCSAAAAQPAVQPAVQPSAHVGMAAKRAMTFADLMALKRVGDPQISVSGKWVMFSATDVSLEQNKKTSHLWVVPVTGGEAHQVTFGDGESNGRFSPDAKYVSIEMKDQIFLAGWDDKEGKPGPARQLTGVSTGASGALWSPDGGRMLFVSSVYPECSDTASFAEEDACDKKKDDDASSAKVKATLFTGLLYRHWDSFTGAKRSHVFAVSVNNGADVRDLTPRSAVATAETPTFSLGGPLGYAWAPDSHEIAYVTNLDTVTAASTNNDIFTLRLDEPNAKALKISTSPGSDDAPLYSPDGKYLAFRSQTRGGYESDRFALVRYDRAAKTIAEAFPSFGGWIDEYTFADRAGESFYFTSAFEGEERIYAGIPGEDVQLVRSGAEFSGIVPLFPASTAANGSRELIAVRMQIDHPSEITRITSTHSSFTMVETRGTDKHDSAQKDRFGVAATNNSVEHPVTHINDALINQLQLTHMQSFWFKGAENVDVQGFLVRPPNFDAKRKYPVKFLIHGGPQGAWGDAWSFRWNPELMAASGYAVVMVNPRGSTGYGQKFIDDINGDWGGRAYVDLMKGLDAAETKFAFLDKNRECALGASYGGFMANWILTHNDRFKCIVSHDGMYNPAAAYGTTEELWFNEWEFRQPGSSTPGQPWKYASLPIDQDPFRKWSPMLSIQNAKTPTLVIHSQKDYRLDVSEGFQLYTALQQLGVPSEMLYFPDEGHWVLKPQNSQLWNQTVADWCDKWTKSNNYAAK